MSTPVVQQPALQQKASPGQIADTILHDVIAAGILAATIFVKNPASQQKASALIDAVSRLLPMLDQQLNPQK